MLIAAAAAAALLAARRVRIPVGAWAPAAFAVASLTLLGYVDALLVVVLLASLGAGLHLAARVAGSGPRGLAWGGACAWGAVAAFAATSSPGVATGVAAAALVVAAVAAVRADPAERVVAAGAVAPLAGVATAAAGWLADGSAPWVSVIVVVVVGVTATALAALRGPAIGRDLVALAAAGAAALVGVSWATDPGVWLAAHLALLGATAAALGLTTRSRVLVAVAVACELGALWVRLAIAEVETPEAYTLPLAAVLLAYGAWWRGRDASLDTVRALGPGLAAGLLPSLVIAMGDPVSTRAALVAVACGSLVTAGAALRLRGPLLAGSGAGLVLVVAELAPYHDAVPRWVSLGATGAVLLTAGIRWEYLAAAGRRGWGRVRELA